MRPSPPRRPAFTLLASATARHLRARAPSASRRTALPAQRGVQRASARGGGRKSPSGATPRSFAISESKDARPAPRLITRRVAGQLKPSCSASAASAAPRPADHRRRQDRAASASFYAIRCRATGTPSARQASPGGHGAGVPSDVRLPVRSSCGWSTRAALRRQARLAEPSTPPRPAPRRVATRRGGLCRRRDRKSAGRRPPACAPRSRRFKPRGRLRLSGPARGASRDAVVLLAKPAADARFADRAREQRPVRSVLRDLGRAHRAGFGPPREFLGGHSSTIAGTGTCVATASRRAYRPAR